MDYPTLLPSANFFTCSVVRKLGWFIGCVGCMAARRRRQDNDVGLKEGRVIGSNTNRLQWLK